MLHCINCNKEFRWLGDYDLPEINILPLIDRDNPGNCDCGGKIIVGFASIVGNVSICRKGDYKEFWSIELGASGNSQKEYRVKHPDAEFNKYGALKIKSASQLDRALKEKGMVCLNESREHREHFKQELDEAREIKDVAQE